jgi:hypothetical protein
MSLLSSPRLERLQRTFESGHRVPALMEALLVCREEGETPDWVLRASYAVLSELFRRPPRARRRAGNPYARWRQDMVHFARYDAVATIRENLQPEQKHIRARLREVYRDDAATLELMLREQIPYDFGRNWDDAYQHASLILRGTFAAGEPAQMKRSYRMAKRALNRCYSCPSHTVLRDLGLFWQGP